MKTGLVVSSIAHVVLLSWGLWSLSGPEPMSAIDNSLPVDLVPIEEFSQSVAGAEDGPMDETFNPEPTEEAPQPDQTAENAGENEVDLDALPTPRSAPRETVQTAAASAPPEPVAPPTPEAVPEPTPQPEPVAEPEPEPTPEPAPEVAETEPEPTPDPVTEAIAEAEAEPDPTPPVPRNVPVPKIKPKPPEPVRVAEARPEPEPKPQTREKPEKPRETEAPAPDKSDFDADNIAALLNREKSSGGGARRSDKPATLGGRETTGTRLAQSEIDALRKATKECWYEPSGSFGAEGIVIEVSFELEPDGSLRSRPRVTATGGDAATRRAYESSASRAVQICAQQGRYRLSAQSYDAWSELTFNFRPGEAY
ncbi:MAG: hypothetical protein KAG89_14490 [Fulvimarina manganoxydans]|uniref:hypothetical protein n=1 Tax=Fulvimarina manganoxydans TaxID=937218 RepID=UPI002355F4E7|nr:hypothetical protein [Fulvimarina manganoxydans]MCK5933369.1 hypothetical protein [Fulvimarina manganoxydans]